MKISPKPSFTAIGLFACILGLSAMHAAAADLVFTGGSINAAGSWNIEPGPGTQKPTNGDIGTIEVDGVIGNTAINFGSAVITQTAGTISTNADNNNLNYLGAGSVYNLEGGRLETRGALANGSTINLLGGVVQLGSTASDSVGFGANGAGGVMNIGGAAEIIGLKSYDIRTGGGATLNILADWSGTWSHPGYPAEATWEDTLVPLNTFYDGTEVTAENFSEIFSVTNGGQTISLANVASPAAFSITDIEYMADANTVTLTWLKTSAEIYIVRFSFDLDDWGGDLADDIDLDRDENPDDADHITVTLPLAGELEDATAVFFRIEES